MRSLAGLLLGMILLAAPSALAQPGLTAPPLPTAASKPSDSRWYGWQIFVADLAVGGLALAVQRTEPLIALWGTGPVVHAAHRRGDAAVQSLLLRVLVPAGAGFLAATSCDEGESAKFECLERFAIGFAIGSLTTLTIDYFVLGREPRVAAAPRIAPAVQVSPTVSTAGVRISF